MLLRRNCSNAYTFSGYPVFSIFSWILAKKKQHAGWINENLDLLEIDKIVWKTSLAWSKLMCPPMQWVKARAQRRFGVGALSTLNTRRYCAWSLTYWTGGHTSFLNRAYLVPLTKLVDRDSVLPSFFFCTGCPKKFAEKVCDCYGEFSLEFEHER